MSRAAWAAPVATLSMVPSTGRATAAYAAAAAASSACRSAAACPVRGGAPFSAGSASASFMPRSNWARMVPELPRAPISAPWDMARKDSRRVGSAPRRSAPGASKTASTASAADSTVR